MQCINPHHFENLWNCLDVNCGPPSDQKMSGAAVRQNNSFMAVISFAAVVSVPIGTMVGQSV